MLMKRYSATLAALLMSFAAVANAEVTTGAAEAQATETETVIGNAAAGNAEEAAGENTAAEKTGKKKKARKPVQYDENGRIIKTGLNFGPLPAVAYDADKGFQLGAILNIYNYGDGSTYPNCKSKWYMEASYFTKGSQLYTLMYDDKTLIPGVRWSSTATASIDKALDFYGFNGYQSFYDYDRIALGDANKGSKKHPGPQDPLQFAYAPYYRTGRIRVYVKSDFIGHITDHLYWQAGYHFRYVRQTGINRSSINKGKPDYNLFPTDYFEGTEQYNTPTLYEQYKYWGLISEKESPANGNVFMSSVRLGLMYDSRDKEGAPTRGIWAEGHVEAAPRWLGNTNAFYRYSLNFRNYVPIVKNDVLTFAYRLTYEGTIGKSCPYYALPYITVVGDDSDKDGFGSYRTCRGIIRSRVVGLDEAAYNVEFRWRFVNFKLWKQNISFGLSAFSDGCMVTRGRSMAFDDSYLKSLGFNEESPFYVATKLSYDNYISGLGTVPAGVEVDSELLSERQAERAKHLNKDGILKEIPHITAGLGLRFIMNENFIVAFEYGMPISRFYRQTSPYYKQDGNGAFYINLGYLF